MFRETFIYQVLIFLDCLQHPIKDQINIFKIDDDARKCLDNLQKRAQDLLKSGKFEKSLNQIINRESIWSKSKNLINKKPDDPDRTFQYDLANFHRPREGTLFAKKRDSKAYDKRKIKFTVSK